MGLLADEHLEPQTGFTGYRDKAGQVPGSWCDTDVLYEQNMDVS